MISSAQKSGYLTITGDLFLNEEKDYWQFECRVQIKDGEVWDTEVISARGAGPDDESLELTDYVEECIKEKAEGRADEQLSDPFTTVDFDSEDE